MRLMEGIRLRIKDVDFDRNAIIVREAKGNKDRVVMMPRSLVPSLRNQLLAARAQWEADRQVQRGGVEVPYALEQKYPKVGYSWDGFGCSRRRRFRLIRAAVWSEGITSSRNGCSAH
jgi:integrase